MDCRRRWVVDEDQSRRKWAVDEDRRRIRWAVDDDRRRRKWAVDNDQSLEAFYAAQVNASLARFRNKSVVVDDYPLLELPLWWRDPPPFQLSIPASQTNDPLTAAQTAAVACKSPIRSLFTPTRDPPSSRPHSQSAPEPVNPPSEPTPSPLLPLPVRFRNSLPYEATAAAIVEMHDFNSASTFSCDPTQLLPFAPPVPLQPTQRSCLTHAQSHASSLSSPGLPAPAPASRQHSIPDPIRSSSRRQDADGVPDLNPFSNIKLVKLMLNLLLEKLLEHFNANATCVGFSLKDDIAMIIVNHQPWLDVACESFVERCMEVLSISPREFKKLIGWLPEIIAIPRSSALMRRCS
ncbi:hypothetical protein M5K25_025230 [Dendrobium thyrsiflorum]|uniref:Uncharacterized protein n=1 Tax=Dendrobium thyrsiflorum TaxID=117978 RepID=A0ABD0U3Y3_DENTH